MFVHVTSIYIAYGIAVLIILGLAVCYYYKWFCHTDWWFSRRIISRFHCGSIQFWSATHFTFDWSLVKLSSYQGTSDHNTDSIHIRKSVIFLCWSIWKWWEMDTYVGSIYYGPWSRYLYLYLSININVFQEILLWHAHTCQLLHWKLRGIQQCHCWLVCKPLDSYSAQVLHVLCMHVDTAYMYSYMYV